MERKIWLLNIEMNLRGVQVDTATIKRILEMIAIETEELQGQVHDLTGGAVDKTTEIEKLLKWVKKNGVKMPNMQAATVDATIAKLPPGPVRKVLRIRRATGKASTKKFQSMVTRASDDGRVRDLAMYHGASTGRESAKGLQVHNFAKGNIADIYTAIKVVQENDRDFIKLVYGDLFSVFGSIARGMIQASPGRELRVADYNAIEARVLHWMAGHKPGLEAWAKNIDQYKKMACSIFGVPISKVTDDQRFVGKQAVLGCGFGMGDRKFVMQCAKFGRIIAPALGKRAVKTYRETHPAVVQMWYNLERAAIKAVMTGRRITVNRTVWEVRDGFLWCQLPSGRRLAYYGPTVRNEMTPWKELRPKLYHWSVNPKTKKWENAATYGGKLTENVVQATARDLTMEAALRAERLNYTYMFQVHDEIITECDLGHESVGHFEKILTKLPAWADGLPVAAKGWSGPRYKKG